MKQKSSNMKTPAVPQKNSETVPTGSAISKVQEWYQSPRSRLVLGVMVGVGFVAFVIWFFGFRPYISTNDARIDAPIVRLANAGMSGPIVKVYVREGDAVTNNTLLIELDHRPAEAQLLRANAKTLFANQELKRMKSLAAQQGVSKQQLDRTQSDADMAISELQLAQIALDRTYLRSPVNGVVIQKLAVEGNMLEASQTAVIVADVDNATVSANISEKVVGRIRKGARVRVHIDAGGNVKGHVTDIRRATASTFALVPSDSASGNYIKVIQRVPIKVELDTHPKVALRVGESVEIRISAW